ncbi:MAG TPA: CRTAC1 family protein [Gammaproteobacteria bacterium]|nr:CRTAC1 family protein [Gammaproteobacteria bacterium]
MSGEELDTGQELVPEDDRVIGRAFRYSVAVIAALAAAGTAAWLLLTRPAPVERIVEAALEAPRAPAASRAQAPPAVRFTDVTTAAGIDFVHHNGAYGDRLLPETMGGGVAFADLDGDGYPDLLFVNGRDWPWRASGAQPTARLYLNRGDGAFEDATAGSGLDEPLYGMGVAVGDYDGDGLRDVFITTVGENRLYRNLDGRRFEDVTAAAGVAGGADEWSTSAAFFDYDGDGDLDLFVTNYVRWSRDIDFEVDYRLTGIGRAYGPPTNFEGTQNYLYRNDGGGRFTDVSEAAGVHVENPATGPAGKGLAVVPVDIDGDGRLDLIVANDTVANFLYRNRSDGRFAEQGATSGLAFDAAGGATGAMGIDAGRYRNNGDVAVSIGNFANEMTSFYVAQAGALPFTDEAIVAGIGAASRLALSFGLFFFDYDLDGRLDLFQTNGHVENEINAVQSSQTYAQPSQLFWNCGEGCTRDFVPVPAESMGALAEPVVGRGAAYADVDGDGDLDVVLTQVGRRAILLRNDQALGHHWLRVRLVQPPPNVDAIGAGIELEAGGVTQYRQVMPARSYLSQVELPVTFGLGALAEVEAVTVAWPDGTRQRITNPPVDRLLVVTREHGE